MRSHVGVRFAFGSLAALALAALPTGCVGRTDPSAPYMPSPVMNPMPGDAAAQGVTEQNEFEHLNKIRAARKK